MLNFLLICAFFLALGTLIVKVSEKMKWFGYSEKTLKNNYFPEGYVGITTGHSGDNGDFERTSGGSSQSYNNVYNSSHNSHYTFTSNDNNI